MHAKLRLVVFVLLLASLIIPSEVFSVGDSPTREFTESAAPRERLKSSTVKLGDEKFEFHIDYRDEFPEEVFTTQADNSSSLAATASACTGNRGKYQIQLLLAVAPGQEATAERIIAARTAALGASQLLQEGSAKTGGGKVFNFVTGPDCQPAIRVITIRNMANFEGMLTQLHNMGFNKPNMKYLVFATISLNDFCGFSTIKVDSRPGINNRNNGTSYGVISFSCTNPWTTAHELIHGLGGVQPRAPHGTHGFHCTDEWDPMCYTDAPGVVMEYVCPPGGSFFEVVDCGNNDYFHTNPRPGTYLHSHWNVANSPFLVDLTRNPSLKVTPLTAHTGRNVRITLTGFAPHEGVRIRLGNKVVKQVRVNAAGKWAGVARIPQAVKPGRYSLTAQGNRGSIKFMSLRVKKGKQHKKNPNRNRAHRPLSVMY